MESYECGNGCGVDMEYIGGADWKCPKCGAIRPFGEPDEDDEYSDESISISAAADIWKSNGCDEDYTSGYTIEELSQYL